MPKKRSTKTDSKASKQLNKQPKKHKPLTHAKAKKKADPIVEDTHSEVEETKPITESKENEYGNN